jgi:hypothetical protein
MVNSRSRLALYGVLCIASIAACESGPTAPAPVLLPGASPDATALTSIEIGGPEFVVPGGHGHLMATMRSDDGSIRTITTEAIWTSSNPEAIDVVAPGEIFVRARGEAIIRVSYGGREGTRTVFGLPLGTFRLIGKVFDDSGPVDGAWVEVLTGAGKGLWAITSGGEYRIYGVGGDTKVLVQKAEYERAIDSIDVGRHETLDFELKRANPEG